MTRRPRGRRWVGAGLIGRVGLIGLGLTLLAILGLIWSVNGPGPSQADRTVFLKRGSGLAGIAATLGQAGVISSPGLFSAAARLAGAGSQLKVGNIGSPGGFRWRGCWRISGRVAWFATGSASLRAGPAAWPWTRWRRGPN